MLLAVIKFKLLDSYIEPKDFSIENINSFFKETEEKINSIIQKYILKGYTMEKVTLEKIETFEELIEVYNKNILAINKAFSQIEEALNSLALSWKDLDASSIKFANLKIKGEIDIKEEQVNITYQNQNGDSFNVVLTESGVENG